MATARKQEQEPEFPRGDLAEAEVKPGIQDLADFIVEQTGYDVDPLSVQLTVNLHRTFQQSEAHQEAKAARAAEREELLASREQKRADREARNAEKEAKAAERAAGKPAAKATPAKATRGRTPAKTAAPPAKATPRRGRGKIAAVPDKGKEVDPF